MLTTLLNKFQSVEQRLNSAQKRIGNALDMFENAHTQLVEANVHLEQVNQEARKQSDAVLDKAMARSSKLLGVAEDAIAHQNKNVRIMERLKDFVS